MKFEYEISADDYVASQTLYYKLTTGSKRFRRAALWAVAGAAYLGVAWKEEPPGWGALLLSVIGAWWVYASWQNLFPAWSFRRFYPTSGLSGKKFQAEISEDGFEVGGDECRWYVRWEGVSVKGEGKRVFMLYGANTIFMFGKKYLTDEQQSELRRRAALPNH